jgi:hypothetical protein
MTAASARWLAFAAIGLLVAVAVAVLATRLVSQKIGISGEPLSAASSLAPEHASRPGQPHRQHGGAPANPPTVSINPTTTAGSAPAPPSPSGAGSVPSGEHGDTSSGQRPSGDGARGDD